MGFHFVGAALLSLLVRGNIIASAIGTVIGNPWTFPFIWIWIYKLGAWLLGGSGYFELPEQLSMHYIFDNFANVFWPMTVGGLLTGAVAWLVFFWLAHNIVLEYQRRRRRRLRRKIMKMRQKGGAARYAGQSAESKG